LDIELILAGFFFWFIIVTNIASERFGYITLNEIESEEKLEKISKNPKDFKISVALIITEHLGIVALAVVLFMAFNSYNLILAVIWTISRTGEGVTQIYSKKTYWGLLNLAEQYSGAGKADKKAFVDSAKSILKTKHTVFTSAQLLFSIGTLAYCIVFVTNGVVPSIIGWLGIVAAILYGSGNGIIFVKPDFKVLLYLGGLLILIFELILGGWLLFSSFM
jgi:hypothetical protein